MRNLKKYKSVNKFKLPNKSKYNKNKLFCKNFGKSPKRGANFTLPKKSTNTIKFDNIQNVHIPIKLNKQLKPKMLENVISKRKLPHWTLRLTKFEHYISSKELMTASVKEKTSKTYLNYGKSFYQYIKEIRIHQPDLPLIKDILNNFDIFQLDVLIYEFLTAKFNKKVVTGGTLHNTACGILYSFAVDFGISLTCELLPGTRKICKGADNILKQRFGDHPKGKFPILNPILEAMLKHANENEQFALLVAQRFCLRSQHYCNNNKENVMKKNIYLKVKDFIFIPNIEDPRAICISTKNDKNNPELEHMERVVYCCCEATKWTCLVHLAKQRFENNIFNPEDALLQCKSGDMHYRAMLKIVKDLIKKIGLNPDNYGTHSCRSGGTTELFLIGKQAVWIQHFGWWRNIGSVMIYIRPNNPDLAQFVNSTLEYTELRAKEGGLLDKREKDFSDLQQEVVKQNRKRIKGNRTSKAIKKAATISGCSKTTIVPSNLAVKRTQRTQHVYTKYNEHTYIVKNGQFIHNPRAKKPHMAVSAIGDVRTVRANINAKINMHAQATVHNIPRNQFNQFGQSRQNIPFSNFPFSMNYNNQRNHRNIHQPNKNVTKFQSNKKDKDIIVTTCGPKRNPYKHN